ncbi:MAG TPA: hypothetical protein VK824_11820 [Planctomycetota bacterium]|nr:hypothetical protein [Planctomycetota bacterium]
MRISHSSWWRALGAVACLALVSGEAVVAQSAAVPPDRIVTPVVLANGSVQVLVSTFDGERGVMDSTLVSAGAAGAAGAAGGQGGGSDATTVGACGAADAVDSLPDSAFAQSFRSAYADVHGTSHTLVTLEQWKESAANHAMRHAAALAVLTAMFPPAASPAGAAGPDTEPGTQYFSTVWVDGKGVTQEVVTVRKLGESAQKWIERHAEGVAAMLIAFPPKQQTACLPADSGLRLCA